MGKECRNGDAWGCELVNIYMCIYIYYVYNIYIYIFLCFTKKSDCPLAG